WRFNGQQHPNAIHMCVTGPQTRPGLVEEFAADLDAAVAYAGNPSRAKPASSGIYGGGLDMDLSHPAVAQAFFTHAMDAFTDCPL
ncbi:MAG TPA: hypothetical protein PL152_01245, partial [Steroidobacteraceae bacterium]|nr:hypothetical protein [Steroidobacteraceae bacterium]